MSPSLLGLDPDTYEPHPVHRGDRSYVETNCYTDIVLELLHARGDEPLAMLGALVRMDFEGDQWTFFKPPPGDLEALFGVDIHEMQPYRPLPEQIAEQLEAGRTMIVELDSFFLPDTAATDYRRAHVKTSVAVEAIDPEARTLRYFHNAGLHELSGEDFDEVLTIRGLPPYAEIARFDAGPRLTGDALRAEALARLRRHLALRPADNPFARFGARLQADLPGLLEGDAEGYHAYAFATVRMAGSAFELLRSHVCWLFGEDGLPSAAEPLDRIVESCKVLSFRLARRRAFDPSATIEGMAAAWQEAMEALELAVQA